MTLKEWYLKHESKIDESVQYIAEFTAKCLIGIFAFSLFMNITARMIIDYAPQVCSILKESVVEEAPATFDFGK